MSHRENLIAAIKALNISPKQLTQVTQNPNTKLREANAELVSAAEELGVNVKLINFGDFVPAVFAASGKAKNPIIVATRGGFEEGIMAAAAAKVMGGFAQGILFNPDHTTYKGNKVLDINTLVPADKNIRA